jgi:hypothetical protein
MVRSRSPSRDRGNGSSSESSESSDDLSLSSASDIVVDASDESSSGEESRSGAGRSSSRKKAKTKVTHCYDPRCRKIPQFATADARRQHYKRFHGGVDAKFQQLANGARERREVSVRASLVDLRSHQVELQRGQDRILDTLKSLGSGLDRPGHSAVVPEYDGEFGGGGFEDGDESDGDGAGDPGPAAALPAAAPPPRGFCVSIEELLMHNDTYRFDSPQGRVTIFPFRKLFVPSKNGGVVNAAGVLNDSAYQHFSFTKKTLRYGPKGNASAYATAGLGLLYAVFAVGALEGLESLQDDDAIELPTGLLFCAQEAKRRYLQVEFIDNVVKALEDLKIGSFLVALQFVVHENYKKFKAQDPLDRGVSLSGITNAFIFMTRFVMFLHRKTSRMSGCTMLDGWFDDLIAMQRKHSNMKIKLDRARKEEAGRLDVLTTKQAMQFGGSLAAVLRDAAKETKKNVLRPEAVNMVFWGFGNDIPFRNSGTMTIGTPGSTLYVDDDELVWLQITAKEKQKAHSFGGAVCLPASSGLALFTQQFYRINFGTVFTGDPLPTKKELEKEWPAPSEKVILFQKEKFRDVLDRVLGARGNLPESVRGGRSVHATLQWLGLHFGWFTDDDIDILHCRMLHTPTTSAVHYLLIKKSVLDGLVIPPYIEERIDQTTRTMDCLEREKTFGTLVVGDGTVFSLTPQARKKVQEHMSRIHDKFEHFCRVLAAEDARCAWCGDYDQDKEDWDVEGFAPPPMRRAEHRCFEELRNARQTGVLAGKESKGAYGAWLEPRELLSKKAQRAADAAAGKTEHSSDEDLSESDTESGFDAEAEAELLAGNGYESLQQQG